MEPRPEHTSTSTPIQHLRRKQEVILSSVRAACSRMAPVWPLDRFIAVNPWWERTANEFGDVAARLGALSGARLLMPREHYKARWQQGQIGQEDLRAACREVGLRIPEAELFLHLERPQPLQRMQLMTHAMDAHRDLRHNMSWETEVTHQLSQFCAAWFDRGQAAWHMDSDESFYSAWLHTVRHERGIGLLMGARKLNSILCQLPEDPDVLLVNAMRSLDVPSNLQQAYLEALLLSINGWASWCAYQRWQDNLAGRENPDPVIRHLLAARLAWEWVLLQLADSDNVRIGWESIKSDWSSLEEDYREAIGLDLVWQRALELAYQRGLIAQLSLESPKEPVASCSVQAYFCIDVRSEVFRRALESVSPAIRTGGFAGFFGLPIAYQPLGLDEARPQLPGLLAPAMTVQDCCRHGKDACQIADRRRQRLQRGSLLDHLRTAGTAVFSYVEAAGILYGFKLVKDGLLGGHGAASSPGLSRSEAESLRPRLPVNGIDAHAEVQLAERVLRAMSLTGDFAPLVLLAGHGSSSDNNPHAAGLDCGACCGQTGEVNSRALAALLNSGRVRSGLVERGIQIPDTTWFIAGLHNTTTDRLALFDLDEAPETFAPQITELQAQLRAAGERCRRERSGRLGLGSQIGERALLGDVEERGRDWSQVRPEWGLAGNASFIVAMRERTRHLNLKGRSFLHDYDWRKDANFSILELIMTAPMVVTHWINMQYYASVVDNRLYGSGNKVLHNVVGGTIGVFEGNGGDLRTGLPMQSIHDGQDWVHEPVRLSVFIDAPRRAIDSVLGNHPGVRNLVDRGWIHLFQLDEGAYPVYHYQKGGWHPASPLGG